MRKSGLAPIALGASLVVLLLIVAFFLTKGRGEIVVAYRASPGEYVPLSATLTRLDVVTEDGDVHTLLRRDRPLDMRATMTETRLAESSIPAGRYTEVRISLAKPLTESGDRLARTTPTLHVPAEFTVESGNTATIILTFQPQYAVYEQEGMDVFVPVIGVETRSNVDVSVPGTITGGTIETNATFGVDFEGNVKRNFRQVR
jgi:hypothetical protein